MVCEYIGVTSERVRSKWALQRSKRRGLNINGRDLNIKGRDVDAVKSGVRDIS